MFGYIPLTLSENFTLKKMQSLLSMTERTRLLTGTLSSASFNLRHSKIVEVQRQVLCEKSIGIGAFGEEL